MEFRNRPTPNPNTNPDTARTPSPSKSTSIAEIPRTTDQVPLLSSKQERYLHDHLHCGLCDAELVLRHDSLPNQFLDDNDVSDSPIQTVKETAHCSHCGIKARVKHHQLQ